MTTDISIREALPSEFDAVGLLMVEVYSQLEDFPTPEEMPDYYEMLASVGEKTKQPSTKILAAFSTTNELLGAVVYFGNMGDYASGGPDIKIDKASGIRLLAVGKNARGLGVGKNLTQACIQEAKDNGHRQVILHSTRVMQVAWDMYEKMGFKRFEDLDFELHGFSIFGFHLDI
ncbi:MAG: GNAT family N-acetyltransferase [Gammaproteobacteria bacterium]|jgi:GNAT superfamily N-acetyltransferase|nr:GNAT family N-acetyltransferase [Gammaproteobacteria bacterium]